MGRKAKKEGIYLGFPGGSDSKESACNSGDLGWIPGLVRSPGEGNGYLLRTEEPGRLQSMELQKVRYWVTNTFTFTMYTDSLFTLLCSRNQHTIVKQLYSNKNSKKTCVCQRTLSTEWKEIHQMGENNCSKSYFWYLWDIYILNL